MMRDLLLCHRVARTSRVNISGTSSRYISSLLYPHLLVSFCSCRNRSFAFQTSACHCLPTHCLSTALHASTQETRSDLQLHAMFSSRPIPIVGGLVLQPNGRRSSTETPTTAQQILKLGASVSDSCDVKTLWTREFTDLPGFGRLCLQLIFDDSSSSRICRETLLCQRLLGT